MKIFLLFLAVIAAMFVAVDISDAQSLRIHSVITDKTVAEKANTYTAFGNKTFGASDSATDQNFGPIYLTDYAAADSFYVQYKGTSVAGTPSLYCLVQGRNAGPTNTDWTLIDTVNNTSATVETLTSKWIKTKGWQQIRYVFDVSSSNRSDVIALAWLTLRKQ